MIKLLPFAFLSAVRAHSLPSIASLRIRFFELLLPATTVGWAKY